MSILFVLVLLVIVVYWKTYPRFGHWLYDFANDLEEKLYGFKKRTAMLDGIEYHFWQNANESKPLLILLHGFSADHTVWLRFANNLNEHFFVVIPDMAGHGATGFDQRWSYTPKAQADRIALLIEQLGHTKAHIVGNSMGGLIAAHLACHTAKCASVTLIDPAGLKTPIPSTMDKLINNGENPFFIDNKAAFKRFYNMVMARPPFIPSVVKDAVCEKYMAKEQELQQIWGDFNQNEGYLKADLPNCHCPALVIWGAKDELIHVSGANEWQQGLNCTAHIWYDLGHMPMVEAPSRTAYAVKQFVGAD
ncbi:alpha/beta fold hydrolase [Alteromonas facilis]|uniref:alpha/beta fold hydrolase n=1 Tax=Alteromonas facilis TaxID=2048004 RepID=UPI000C28A2EA|nr:alpha/beta fold hydrolase [Alteromonas facilis]